jgi:hypothetical protein
MTSAWNRFFKLSKMPWLVTLVSKVMSSTPCLLLYPYKPEIFQTKRRRTQQQRKQRNEEESSEVM